jgi:uncharacterized membrane-anchored protein YhcB (DUF1043 family)
MWWLAVIAVLVGVFLLVLFQDLLTDRRVSREAETEAAIELHRVRRRLDVTDIRAEQRRDLGQLRQEIGDGLDGRQ